MAFLNFKLILPNFNLTVDLKIVICSEIVFDLIQIIKRLVDLIFNFITILGELTDILIGGVVHKDLCERGFETFLELFSILPSLLVQSVYFGSHVIYFFVEGLLEVFVMEELIVYFIFEEYFEEVGGFSDVIELFLQCLL